MIVGLTFHGPIPFWCGPDFGVEGDNTLFTNFVPWRKMKPWEFGLADVYTMHSKTSKAQQCQNNIIICVTVKHQSARVQR